MSMSELRVGAAHLRLVSTDLSATIAVVPLDPSFCISHDDLLGARPVASGLRDGSAQQASRAHQVSDALQAVARFPASAVTSFSEADAALARAF
ncbi:hypothetical protein [Leifsonia poae]|uniref:hypothetical protein n=1 Tax=Leifsonia poae TaxID=110933 RepID=UPI003D67C7B2